ncbi:MAG: hypothetical protein EZS28_041179 [Streblomastix strix]|uniref:DDE-1 domain-containing protein n=1 Tax=Streblomastix strix TaxID=222440 RepID=A0A5J4TZ84_9EUKA|nr:MAG: hypothetical protein EZS28_041179 [Streblomastix strix]
MSSKREMLTVQHIKLKLTKIFNEYVIVRILKRIGTKPLFSFKEQAWTLFDEIKACHDITFSYRTLEEHFMLKKSRLCELMGIKGKVKREEHNRRRFTDPDKEFHAQVGRAFVESFLRRHYDEVVERWCNPRESGRMEVNRNDCDRYHSDLVNYVAGKPTCAIIAIDESGSQDWPDSKPQLMLVTAGSTNQQLHQKVKRNGNLHTDIFNVDVVIVYGSKGYVNFAIFRAWVIDVLIQYVDLLRPTMLGENEEAILLMDNLQAHRKEETLPLLIDTRI